jgi:hypothetical protein
METPSSDEDEIESKAPPAPPKQPPVPKVRLSKTVLVCQPTFEDELVVPKLKKPKVEKSYSPLRLSIASKSTIHGVIESMESMGYTINIYGLNYAMRFTGNVTVVPCHAYRNGSPAENFDVQEKGDWDPGKAELDGFAVLAWEIAEDLVNNDRHGAVIVSEQGGEAVKLLAGCVCQAVRRLVSKDAAIKIVGSRAIQPSSKNPDLCKIYKSFGSWTKVTARAEISKCIA